MIITFLGHSSLVNSENLLVKITETILKNTRKDENISFFCGGYGDFDNLSALACRLVKEERPNSEVAFVTPYIKNQLNQIFMIRLFIHHSKMFRLSTL